MELEAVREENSLADEIIDDLPKLIETFPHGVSGDALQEWCGKPRFEINRALRVLKDRGEIIVRHGKGGRDRLTMLPQALRVIIPPMTSQYLNLTKNSSLAVAIGYPDLVSIANTTLNQTGRAIEALSIVMLVYLTLSLTTSALMNWFNARAAILER